MNTPRLEDLGTIEAAVWRELDRAVLDSGHAWHVGVLATHDGELADARCVVLREIDVQARALVVYTDPRSAKARQIADHPLGTLVLWSDALGWQLRLRVTLGLETSGLAVSSRWARLKLTPAAHDYLAPLPPGSPLAGPCARVAPQRESRAHFAVLAARVTFIDWLELDARGHRRAQFDAEGARWVVP